MIKQLSVEYVRDLAAYQAKELTDMFGMATGNTWHAHAAKLLNILGLFGKVHADAENKNR